MTAIIGDLDELTSLLRRSARQVALDVTAEATRRVAQGQDQAQAEAQRVRDTIIAAAHQEDAEKRRRGLAQVALEVQRQRLVAREALLTQVWAEAERQLRAAPAQPTYGAVLRGLALAAAAVLGGETIVLAADGVGHTLLTPAVLAEWSTAAHVHFVRAEQPAPIWGGLLARDITARRQVDSSFATRLTLAYADRREQVARQLGIV